MHESLDLETFNVRISKLNNKMLNKMKEIYHIPKTENRYVRYKYSEYGINEPPIRERKRSLAQRINKYILRPANIPNPIKTVRPRDDWEPPDPIFKK